MSDPNSDGRSPADDNGTEFTEAKPVRRRKPYDKERFRKLHEAHNKLDFTPDFNPAVEALIRDEGMPRFPARLLQLYKFQAWANQSNYAVHDGTEEPFAQADAAKMLGVRRQRVHEGNQYLEATGYLIVEGKKHYPVDDPEAQREQFVRAYPDKFTTSSPEFRLFRADYFREHPKEAEKYEEAVSVLKETNALVRAAFRAQKSGANGTSDSSSTHGTNQNGSPATPGQNVRSDEDNLSGTEWTNGDPIFIEEFNFEFTGRSLSSSSFSASNEPLTTTTSPNLPVEDQAEMPSVAVPDASSSDGLQARSEIREGPVPRNEQERSRGQGDAPTQLVPEVRAALLEFASVVDEHITLRLISKCRDAAPDVTGTEIAHFVHEKGPDCEGKQLPYLVAAVVNCMGSPLHDYRAQLQRAKAAPEAEAAREEREGQGENVWGRIKAQLAPKLSREAYSNWISRSRLVSFADGRLIVSVPDETSQLWIEQEYTPQIWSAIQKLDLAVQSIAYEVHGRAEKAGQG